MRESGVGNKDSPLLGHCYPRHLRMSSFLETDIRDVLRLGQLGKPMTHTRKPHVAGDAARSPRVVDGKMTPITVYRVSELAAPSCPLKSDMAGDFISFFGRIICVTTKRDDGGGIDEGLPALSINDQGRLAFLRGRKQLLHVGNGLWGRQATWFTLCR